MNKISICAMALGLLIFSLNSRLPAADTNTAAVPAPPAANSGPSSPSPVMADLNALVAKVNEKITAEKTTEADLADEIKQFDVLLARHKDARPEERAQILLMKAQLFTKVIDKPEAALDAFKQLKRDCPGIEIPGGIDAVIAELEKTVRSLKIQRSLVPGAQFPTFSETDVAGKPLSLASYKGKVVLVNFWATWCMPCMIELPHVQKTYEKYHGKGFDVIGISLDIDRSKLEHFLKDKKMPWQQYNDGKFWDTKLVPLYGVTALPATFLLDREGKIIGKNLRGDELEKAVAFETMPWFQKHLVSSGRHIDHAVRGYPYQSLGVIFAAGLFLGIFARRKDAKAPVAKP